MKTYPFYNHDTEISAGKMSFIRLFPQQIAHQHSFFELIYVMQGSAIRQMPDSEIIIRAGDYYFIPPFDGHGYADTQNFEVISCLFREKDIMKTFRDSSTVSSLLGSQLTYFGLPADKPIYNQIFHDSDGTVKKIIQKMEQEYSNCQMCYVEMFRFYLAQILVIASRACKIRTPHSAVAQIAEFIKVHYAENISLDMLSQLVGYTPQYLSSLFSQEVGVPLQVFVQHVRMEEACTLLSRTDQEISKIAAAVGYPDYKYFSKVFRRHQNVSPREYRKMHKK